MGLGFMLGALLRLASSSAATSMHTTILALLPCGSLAIGHWILEFWQMAIVSLIIVLWILESISIGNKRSTVLNTEGVIYAQPIA